MCVHTLAGIRRHPAVIGPRVETRPLPVYTRPLLIWLRFFAMGRPSCTSSSLLRGCASCFHTLVSGSGDTEEPRRPRYPSGCIVASHMAGRGRSVVLLSFAGRLCMYVKQTPNCRLARHCHSPILGTLAGRRSRCSTSRPVGVTRVIFRCPKHFDLVPPLSRPDLHLVSTKGLEIPLARLELSTLQE